MTFKDNYSTVEINDAVQADKDISLEVKDQEFKKQLVSNDAFLNAEMLETLIKELKALRLK